MDGAGLQIFVVARVLDVCLDPADVLTPPVAPTLQTLDNNGQEINLTCSVVSETVISSVIGMR